MPPRWLFKSAGRTASHLLLGVVESAGYQLCWTEQYATDFTRTPILSQAVPQVWYDHQRGWPNPEVNWQIVLIRRRDFRKQVLSKILSQYTQEFVFFTDRVFEPKTISRDEFDWTAKFIIDCETDWIQSAPSAMPHIYREDIVQNVQSVLNSIGIPVTADNQSRFEINPRSLESICANWDQVQKWTLPDKSV